jgi:hypothetical protein
MKSFILLPRLLAGFGLVITFALSSFGAWTTSNLGTNPPPGAAINIDINNNFSLLFGGTGYAVAGDMNATGESIMYQTNAKTDNYGGALYSSSPHYMTEDATFNTATYTGGDPRKANSSSATLKLPPYVTGQHIVWAGLFWQGQVHTAKAGGFTTAQVDTNITGWNKVTFKTPDGVKHSITAPIGTKNSTSKTYNYTYKDDSMYRHYYSGYYDVTQLVKDTYSKTDNNFTVGNILVTDGADSSTNLYFSHIGTGGAWDTAKMGHFGGWSLVVVYALDAVTRQAQPAEKFKNIAIYDGFDQFTTWGVDGTSFQRDININGFFTPKSGAVNSKMLFFGGGADQGIQFEKLQIQQKKTAGFSDLTNTPNPLNNQFNSSFTSLGSQMNPLKSYHHGIDLDIFDTSAMMDNAQTTTAIRFGVTKSNGTCDQVFPQVIGFTAQLYEPQLCYDYSYKQDGVYLKSDNTGHQLPYLKGTTGNSPIDATIYIRNIEADIDASHVSFYTTDVNSSKFAYVNNSIATSNINGSSLITQNDSGTGCDYNDTATTPIGCVNEANVRIGLGKNATGYSINGAGNFSSKEFAYAKFSLLPLNVNGVKEDVNESLGLKLDYTIRPTGVTDDIIYNYTLGSNMSLCPSTAGYAPTWGTFNVVDAAAGSYTSHANSLPYNNLRTQVSRKPFDVNVAAYGKYTDGTYTIRPTADLNTTLVIEMIDIDAFHDANASCANPDSNISAPIFVPLKVTAGAAGTMLNAIPTQSESYYDHAVKNGAFRIWYFDDNTPAGILIQNWHATTVADSKGQTLTANGLSGLFNAGVHTECLSTKPTPNCSDPSSPDCFTCIKANYAKPLCSRDNFSVRPESYDIRLYDVNQTLNQNDTVKDSTKVAVSEQYHYPPTYAAALGDMPLAAGYTYRYDLNATGHDTDLSRVPGYTRNFDNSNPEYTATMKMNWNTAAKTGCNDTSDKPISLYFGMGQVSNLEHNVSQVGEYRFNILDTSWTEVDWKASLTAHHTTANGFELISGDATDCTIGTTITPLSGKIGCNISSDHNNTVTGQTYKDPLVQFKPAKFDLSTVTYGLGMNVTPIAAGGSGFVYDSNLSITSDMPMAVRSSGSIKALGYNNSVLSNFVTQCYASDINVSISHDANASYSFVGRIDSNATYNATASPAQTISASSFAKANNGVTSPTIRLNVNRDVKVPQLQLTVQYYDQNVSCATTADCNLSAMSTTIPNKATGSKAMDFNVTHVYGRVVPSNVRVMGLIAFETIARYEAYMTPTLLGTPLTPDPIEGVWNINTLHTEAEYGDAAVGYVDPTSGSSLPLGTSTYAAGVESYRFAPYTTRQNYKGHINTEGWLWYNTNASAYVDPPAGALSCLTHPCFDITFGRLIGNTGSAKTESETHKSNKKTSSGTGWSTTSEYAPSIR